MKTLKNIFILSFAFIFLMGVNGCSKKKGWVAKIEGDKITIEEFNIRFEYYLKSKYMQLQRPDLIPQARNNMEERKAALRDMINERLILKEAEKLKLNKREEVKNLIKLYTQQIVLNAYIEEYLAGDINVTEAEINDFYNKNKANFRGMDPEMAQKRIRYQLMMQKYDKKIVEVLASLKNKYRIDENESAIRPIVSEANIMDRKALPSKGGMTMPRMPQANIKKPAVEAKPAETKVPEETKKEETK